MKKMKTTIQKKIENITRYGIGYQLERVLLRFGLKKDISVRSLQKIQGFYEKLDKKDYPKYLKKWYLEQSGRELDLKHPKRLTEKIQWLKLYDSTEVKTRLADKLLVRDWVAEKIGEEYLIPLYGAWDSFDEIDFERLPDSFVLKCNHGCAMNEIVKDKNTIDKKLLKKKVDRWMKTDFAFTAGSFELHYHDIPRKIIAEKYMKDERTEDLQDYKFFCFHGKPMYCQVIGSRTTNETIDFFDMDWNHMPFIGLVKNGSTETNSTEVIPKPQSFELMKKSAEILSEEFSFVRVDFYEINGEMYFGEMTFTPGSGSGSFRPDQVDFELGELLNLRIGENE